MTVHSARLPEAGTASLASLASSRRLAPHTRCRDAEEATRGNPDRHESFVAPRHGPWSRARVVRNLSVFFEQAAGNQPLHSAFCSSNGPVWVLYLASHLEKNARCLWALLPCTVQGQPKLHATVRVAFQLFDVDAWVAEVCLRARRCTGALPITQSASGPELRPNAARLQRVMASTHEMHCLRPVYHGTALNAP